jgi:PAS domain S-box-containing protein
LPVRKLLNENDDVIKKWNKFVYNDILEKESLRDIIAESWERSRRYGINPFGEDFPIQLNKEEFKKRYTQFTPLLETAKPFMYSLYNIIKNTDFIIRLVDRDGYVLEHIGEEKIIKLHHPVDLRDGYNVREELIGTNATGLSLLTGEPIQVLGGEHYLKVYHTRTSSACPIKNENGEILGVLSITGHYELVHPHTLGMIVAAAEAIEKEMKLEETNKKLTVMNKHFYEITESLSEGIIRIDHNGVILNLNRFARKLLSLKQSDVIGKKFRNILAADNREELIEGILNGKEYEEEEEIYFKTRTGRKKTCLATVKPIKFISKRNYSGGAVITFKENKVVHKLVNKIVGANARFTFEDILGKSDSIKHAIKLASISANTDTTILLQGESGTGKEMFAQAIHNESIRKDRPFVFLNCGAIPRELVSSELFGYVEGAFTGAKRGGHPGKFELADGGTIFLDEIGDMPLDAQTSLLRVLQDQTVVRVGGHNVIPIDVRVIAATHKDLKKEVELGNFRRDLYYRINVMPIYTPALRNRKNDIKALVEYFLEKFCEKSKKTIKGVNSSFYKAMINYHWPGNVRELQNIMQLVINVAENNSILTSKNLPEHIRPIDLSKNLHYSEPLLSLEEIEKNAIDKTVREVGGNMAAAAKILGIGRSTLYRKMEKYNMKQS